MQAGCVFSLLIRAVCVSLNLLQREDSSSSGLIPTVLFVVVIDY